MTDKELMEDEILMMTIETPALLIRMADEIPHAKLDDLIDTYYGLYLHAKDEWLEKKLFEASMILCGESVRIAKELSQEERKQWLNNEVTYIQLREPKERN